MTVPAGFVDPTDQQQVTEVCAAALKALGWPALLALLGRIPGLELIEGRERSVFKAAVPARVATTQGWLVLGATLQLEHIVGGIVLSHTDVAVQDAPALLAAAILSACQASGSVEAVSVELTTLRDTVELQH